MASTYLTRTPSSGGNRKTFTISAWIKRSKLSSTQIFVQAATDGSTRSQITLRSDDMLEFYSENGGVQKINVRTNRVLRDTNAWYHVVLAVDTTQATASNRVKIYINGTQETSLHTAVYGDQNYDTQFNHTVAHTIGRRDAYSDQYFDGLMSHFHIIDNTAYAASNFGSTDGTTGEWNINTQPSVTYGTNGFFVLKDTNSGTDQSTNTNNLTVNGTLTATKDNPSNVFATINPLLGADVIGSTVNYYNGNTRVDDPSGSASGINPNFISTLGMPSSGKWYCELKPNSFSTSSGHSIGIYRTKGSTDDTGLGNLEGNGAKIRYIYADTSIYIIKYGTNDQTGLTSISSGDIVGMALDLDNGTLQYYVNGSARHNPITGINSANDGYDYFFHAGLESSSSGRYGRYYWNFGNGYFATTAVDSNSGNGYQDSNSQGKFQYQPPTNFLALCTKNLNI